MTEAAETPEIIPEVIETLNIPENNRISRPLERQSKDLKRPESAGLQKTQKIPVKPTKTFQSMTEKQKTEAYYNLYDTNIELKNKQNELEERVKQLTTQLTRIVADIKYERDLAANSAGGEIKAKIQALSEEKEKISKENLELKQKLKEKNFSQGKNPRQGGQKNRPPTIAKFNTQPVVLSKDRRADETLEERDRLIERLKEQLQQTEIELLRSKGDKGLAPDLTDSFKEKATQLLNLEQKFSSLEQEFLSQKTYLELTKKMLEENQVSLREERTKSSELTIRLNAAEMAAKGSKDLALKLREVVSENKQLEMRVKELCQSPFIKESGDRVIIGTKITLLEKELEERLYTVNDYKERVLRAESELARTKQELDLANIERSKLKDENLVLNVKLSEKGKYVDDFDEKLKVLVQDKDSEAFMKAIGMMKLEGRQPVWSQLDMIERAQSVPGDVPGLMREIERLKIEKGDLAAELEKYQNLITLKAQIEEEKTAMIKAENENLKFQLRAAQKRIEELSKLSDYRANKLKQFSHLQGPKLPVSTNQSIENLDLGGGFIEGGTEVDTGENIFDLMIIDADYNLNLLPPKVIENIKNLPEFLTFMTVDFYNHESQLTSICEGLRPKFEVHISFKVSVDNLLLKYLQADFVIVEAHLTVGDRYMTIGKGKIPLKVLIEVSRAENLTRVIESACVLYSRFDEKVVIGGFRYKMRMRYPMNEIFDYYEDRQEVMVRPTTIDAIDASQKPREYF